MQDTRELIREAAVSSPPVSPTSRRAWWLGLALLAVLALLPRLRLPFDIEPGQPQWTARAGRFWGALTAGELQETYLAPHPGLTVMWAAGGAMALLGARYSPEQLVVSSQAVGALSVALLVGCVGWIAALRRRQGLRGPRTAALAVGLALALDPVLVLTTGLAGLDGVFALFLLLGLLALADHADRGSRGTLAAAAVTCGLAVATKGPGLALLAAPALFRWRPLRAAGEPPPRWGAVAAAIGGLLAGTVLVVWALLPAAWIDPLHVAERLLWGGGAKSESLARVLIQGRENYLFGTNADFTGPALYVVNLLVRATPLALLGALGGLFSARFRRDLLVRRIAAFGGLLLLVLTLAQQKEWRYVIPLLAFLDVLGALGLASLCTDAAERLARPALRAAPAVLLLAQGAWVVAAHPWYELRTNPLLGSPVRAAHWVQLGWTGGWLATREYLVARAEALGRPVVVSGGSPKWQLYERPGDRGALPVVWAGERGPAVRNADCHAVHLYDRMFGTTKADQRWRERGREALRVEPYGVLIVELRCREAALRRRGDGPGVSSGSQGSVDAPRRRRRQDPSAGSRTPPGAPGP